MVKVKSAFSSFSVDNLEEAKQFYIQTLKLTVDEDMMGLQIRLPGGGVLFVYPKDDHEPASFTVLNLMVDDIDDAIDELEGLGVVFERYNNLPAQQDEKGVLRGRESNEGPDIAWFKDPADNIFSLMQE